MYEQLISLRNKIFRWKYQHILKPIFFLQDPENVHDKTTNLGRFLGSNILTRKLTNITFNYQNKILQQEILGITFKNPIGLPGGFDKNCHLTKIIPEVGFGFVEIGSITGEPCPGNPKPRLWRLKNSKSLAVYYGLKNDGCEIIKSRIKPCKVPLGINIAKTNCKETVDLYQGINDYLKSYNTLKHLGDYITINISCPNTFGGEPFTDPIKLDKLLTKLEENPTTKPIFLKLSPDLTEPQLDEIINVVDKHNIQGFISTNLTKNRNNEKIKDKVPEKGGLSGPIVKNLATEQISKIYKKTKGKYIIIGSGGISTPEDAYNKIKAGASLLQLITGMIYEGPQVISEINQGLTKLLKKDNYKNISEAIGANEQLPRM